MGLTNGASHAYQSTFTHKIIYMTLSVKPEKPAT
jgi:hypothetical protein